MCFVHFVFLCVHLNFVLILYNAFLKDSILSDSKIVNNILQHFIG